MAVSLPPPQRRERARSPLPPQPTMPDEDLPTRADGSSLPACVSHLTHTPQPALPQPCRTPLRGRGSPISHRGMRWPSRPRREGLSPQAGYGARAQRTLDGLQVALPGRERAVPQAGRTPRWAPTCPAAPHLAWGSRAPGVSAGREPLACARRAQLVRPAAGRPPGPPRLLPPRQGQRPRGSAGKATLGEGSHLWRPGRDAAPHLIRDGASSQPGG